MAQGRIIPGQRLTTAISARAWNRAQDAADIVLGDRGGIEVAEGTALDRAANIVLVKNVSGHDVPRFGVLGIAGIEIDPTGGDIDGTDELASRAREFARRPVLRGETPSTTLHGDTFVVLLEPCSQDAIARAAVSGCFAVRVHITSTNHRFATIRNNDRTQLASASCGVMQLIWKEPSGTGQNKWALGVM